MKKNNDDNRPLCPRCGEPIIYGQKEYHNQHCRECGKLFCLVHECDPWGGKASKSDEGRFKPETCCVELTKRIFTPVRAVGVIAYNVKEETLLIPEADETILTSNILNLVRDPSVQEFTVKVNK